MKVLLALDMLYKACLKCISIDILLLEDNDYIYVCTWTVYSKHIRAKHYSLNLRAPSLFQL